MHRLRQVRAVPRPSLHGWRPHAVTQSALAAQPALSAHPSPCSCRALHSQPPALQLPRSERRSAARAGVAVQTSWNSIGSHPVASAANQVAATATSTSPGSSDVGAATSSAAAVPGTSTLYTSFAEMGVPDKLVSRLSSLGISAPTLIQQRVIPFLQRYAHTGVLVHAPTGTGKSLAFLLPMVAKLLEQRAANKNDPAQYGIQAIVMCPTQELALQTQAQLHALLSAPGAPPPPPLGVGAESFVALCVGGFHTVEAQRAHLLAHTPWIVVGTPRRLNSVFFPLYETHGTWKQKQKSDEAIWRATAHESAGGDVGNTSSSQMPRRLRPRDVIIDPPEDDEPVAAAAAGVDGALDPNDWPSDGLKLEEDENAWEEGGESHRVPDYAAARAARNEAAKAEWAQRNNVALAAGDTRSPEQRRQQEEEEDEDAPDPELDGADELFMPPRYAVGWEGQKLLLGDPQLLKAKVHSPLKRVLRNVQYLVIDEADEVLQPLSRRARTGLRLNRDRHPKASNIFVRALTLLSPPVQLVAASATINAPLRRLVRRLGFDRPHPVHIRVESRGTGEAQARKVAQELAKAQERAVLATGSANDATGSNELTGPLSDSTSLTSPFASSLNAYTSPSRALGVPLASALQYTLECPPNLRHFYVLAPAFNSWRLDHHAEQPNYPRKVAYDHRASAEARQAVHEHNLSVSHQLRRNAHLLDKLATVAVLLHHYKPRAALLVVDELNHPDHKLGRIADTLTHLGVRAGILFHHLSSPDLASRAAFFRDVAAGRFDVLLVSLHSLRGLDLPMCDLVVALSCARVPADYVHMAGRTGRMGREGSVLTLLHPEELAQLDVLTHSMPETLTDAKQMLPPQDYPAELKRRILAEYARVKPQRTKEIEAMTKELERKMKRKVQPDPEPSGQ